MDANNQRSLCRAKTVYSKLLSTLHQLVFLLPSRQLIQHLP